MNQFWTPVFRQILDSSIWEEEPHVRVLWITMLVIASEPGRDGEIDMTERALAGRACLSLDQTRSGLERLMAPDKGSRSPLEEGRRLVPTSDRGWGWRIVNWRAYEDARKTAYSTNRKQRERAKDAGQPATERDEVTPGHTESQAVTSGHALSHQEEKKRKDTPYTPTGGLGGDSERASFSEFWEAYPKQKDRGHAEREWGRMAPTETRAALEAVQAFADAWKRAPPDRQVFIPAAAKWLAGKRWTDDPAQWGRDASGPGGDGRATANTISDAERARKRERDRLEYNRRVAEEVRAIGRSPAEPPPAWDAGEVKGAS